MHPAIIHKRWVRISRIRSQEHNPSIDMERGRRFGHPVIPSPQYPVHTFPQPEFSHMQERLHKLLESWSRSEAEDRVIIIDPSLIPPVNNALIFRFVSKKSMGIKELESALNAMWRTSAPANVYEVGEEIYVVQFKNATDCNRVLAKQPWHLGNALMVFKKAVGNEIIEDLALNEVPFWVQVHGLELRLMTRYVGELLGNIIGRVIEVDCPANSIIAWGECLRVRVLINVAEPLPRGTKINCDGISSKVLFRYEKLGEFCCVCGKLDHVEKDCPKVKRQYDTWLKADGTKGVSLEELRRSIKRMSGEERMKVIKGEELARQVMQVEGMGRGKEATDQEQKGNKKPKTTTVEENKDKEDGGTGIRNQEEAQSGRAESDEKEDESLEKMKADGSQPRREE